MPFIGHTSEDGRTQLLKEHLEGTAELAASFAAVFDAAEWGYLEGLCHDIGKYSQGFQKRILHNGKKVDHSTAGAKLLKVQKNAAILSFCVAGHHTGLQNKGTGSNTADDNSLCGRLKKQLEGNLDYSAYKEDNLPLNFNIAPAPIGQSDWYAASFFIRMLYSCLVDADFLDTEKFVSNAAVKRGEYEDIRILYEKLSCFIEGFKQPANELNKRRSDILSACLEKADNEPGLYSLTVPTGGGKTIASLAFALKHAVKYNKKRIIYVIPYTSIIEQNAGVFADILGSANIVEHHTNVIYDEADEAADIINCKKLATENWDAPIIVTTNVQFFESLYANKPSRCRKLHNIADSVIIFDEAQMLPVKFLKPCVRAIEELTVNYKTTAVLCTATQPPLGNFFSKGINITEICPRVSEYYEQFKRVTYKVLHRLESEQLLAMLNEKSRYCAL